MFRKTDHTEVVLHNWMAINKKVYWIIVNIINDKQLAEDAIQEALLIAIDKYATLRDPTKFEPWFIKIAIRIAYSLSIDNMRTFYCDDNEIIDIFEYNNVMVDESLLESEYKEMVFRILTKLEPPQRKYLFYLRYIEEKKLDEISHITGIKEGTLKTVYFRMRNEIGTLLAKEDYING